jgi:hypothetical protein
MLPDLLSEQKTGYVCGGGKQRHLAGNLVEKKRE